MTATMFSGTGLLSRQEIHDALDDAEAGLLVAQQCPASRERIERIAGALEKRAEALRLFAMSRPIGMRNRHIVRAVELAAQADRERAATLRRRLAGGR